MSISSRHRLMTTKGTPSSFRRTRWSLGVQMESDMKMKPSTCWARSVSMASQNVLPSILNIFEKVKGLAHRSRSLCGASLVENEGLPPATHPHPAARCTSHLPVSQELARQTHPSCGEARATGAYTPLGSTGHPAYSGQ